MHTSAKGAAAHTAADLDAMDDKLRRLGLDVDHVGEVAAAAKTQSSDDYLRRIRTAKAEKQQAQRDRVARQAVTAEKHLSVHPSAASGNRSSGAQPTEETLAADKALLASDTAEAAVRAQQDYQKSTTQQIRAERMLHAAQEPPPQSTRHTSTVGSFAGNMAAGSPGASAIAISVKDTMPWSASAVARADAKRRAVAPWCGGVAQGIIELAMEMSDHRHLPATGLAGRPVYRLQQDLGVTQWRDAVEQHVFARAALADAAAEAETRTAEATRDGRCTRGSDSTNLTAAAPSASVLAAAEDTALHLEASRCIEMAARAAAEEATQAQQRAVAAVLSKLQVEVARQRKAAEEVVRREADEAPTGEALTLNPSVVGGQREEVLPGWAQRMPPAGCFVYGDDLSGARLLSDTIELCMQRSFYLTQQAAAATTRQSHHSTHAPPAALSTVLSAAAATDSADNSHRGPAGDVLEAGVSNVSFGKPSPPKDPLAHFTASEIGVESGEGGEGGVAVTYITPKTLMGGVAMANLGSDSRRTGSASRGARAQTHGSPTSGAPAISPSGAASTASGAGGGGASGAGAGGGGGGSAVRSGRRASAAASDGRRGVEQQLAEAAVREMVRVHRHNLGVLVGDKIPAWSRVTATPSAGDTEESEHDAVRAPLQALVLVGFPDTASFAEVLAERLRNATAAAEVELLELEARRRAAEQQAVANAAATETTKPRSPSTKSAKGAAAPSRQKTKGSPKTAVEAEECAVTSVTEQLRALFALPPLSVLSVFLSYDVPTRQQRLEDAAFAAEPPPSTLRGMSDSNEDDIVATLAAGGPGCEFMHPIFHPWRVEEKEVVEPSRTGSFRRPVGGAAAAVAASTPVLAFATTATPPHGFARSLDVWSVPTLRTELEQQDARQHLQRQAWTGAVASAFGRKAREMASAGADLRRVPASFYAAGKRRDKQLPGSAAQDGDRSVQASRLTSITTTPGKVATDGAAFPGSPLGLPPAATADGAAKLSAPQLLPRAIFFARVLDVSDLTAPMPLSEDAGAPADSRALGHAVWRFSVTSTAAASNNAGSAAAAAALSSDGLPDLLHMTARAATVDRILTQLHLLCRPAGGRALSSDLLVPHQLPEPFRLGDYRLADALCVRLRQVHEVYSSLLPDPASVQRVDRGAAKQDGDAASGVAAAALQAETEAWGAVVQYAEGLYSLVARNVFADGTAGAEAGVAHAGDEKARFVMTAGTMNSTARFTNIDRGYANVKDAIAQHTSRAVTRIQDCLALLLRLSVDVYVAQLAAMVRLFCTLLDRPSQAKAGGHIGFACLPPSTLVDSEIEGAFLSAVPRLPEGAARSLVAQLLHQPHPQPIDDTRAREAARNGFCATLDRTYWTAVKAAAVEVLSGYFARRAKDVQLAESSAVAADGTPSWDDVSETPHAAVRPAAVNIPAENLSAVAALLLEHATTAPPVPLSRLALLLQEFQCKARALHDGADAWVEKLYHDVLAAQPGRAAEAPQQQQPQQQHQRRPQSIDELADGPQAVLAAAAGTSGPLASVHAATAVRGLAHADPAAKLPSPSRWRCGELELFLASMPQPDHYGAVTTTSFHRGLLMNQLPRLWRFLPECATALAEQVGYAVTAVDAVVQQRGRRASSSSPSAHAAVLPDTALDAYLVHDCPCKHTAAASVAVPFLTVENVLQLAALATGEGGPVVTASAVAAATAVSVGNVAPPVRAPLMHLRRWLIELALGRCCFCAHGAACAAHAARSLAAGHAAGARAATRRFVPPPSSRALRQTLLSLPPAVLEQAASLSTVHTIPIGLMTPLPPLSAQMVAGWVQAQWWWETDGGEDDEGEEQSDAGARRDVALCWTLWRVLLRPSLYTDGEGKTAASAAAVAAVPSLISLLRLLLIGAPGEGNPLEERVRRAFHCLAALRGVREGRTEASMSVKDGDAAVAMAIEDDMALTREEYTLLGDLLTVPMSPMAPEAAPWGGMQTTRGVADLVTDVQLLLQVEGTERVTLPLLLSSRWAQLLLTAHF